MIKSIKTFFVPGPTGISEEINQELIRPVISHRSQEYKNIQKETVLLLKTLFGWENYNVYLFTSSATGVMEGTIRNCVNEHVIHTTCGAFSEKWAEISEMNDKKTHVLDVPWGYAIKPLQLKKYLLENKNKFPLEAITFTHCETSTGVLNPIEDLCKVVKEVSPKTLIFVDAVSAFGGAPLDLEKCGIDIMFFGVQKTFALPPGLSVGVISKRAYEKSLTVKNRGYYFNFEVFEEYAQKDSTPATPAIQIIYALKKQLERISREGVLNRYNRHAQMQTLIEKFCKKQNIEFFSENGFRSPTVSTIKKPENFDIQEIVSQLKEKGYTVPGGYGPLKDLTFRIGHMGEHNEKTIKNLLDDLTQILTSKK
jgi:aspartate aminotransferase-like enzyme